MTAISNEKSRKYAAFARVNARAMLVLPTLLERWLPDGKICGQEYIALNPHRDDRNLGSFKINMNTGRWADFATGDKGGDVISLAAYLFKTTQGEAMRHVAKTLGVKP